MRDRNGACKTTFATEFLPNEAGCFEFVNADLIAAGISPFQPKQVSFLAGRIMLARIRELALAGKNFAVETTLSSRSYLRMIPEWQKSGYQVELHFLKLPDAAFAIRRVQNRVRLGGHDIPIAMIRRRFSRGLKNFHDDYKTAVNQWFLYDSSQIPVQLLNSRYNSEMDRVEEIKPRYCARSPLDRDAQKIAGIMAAFQRASEKAIAQTQAAGLELVLAPPVRSETKTTTN